jgi:hypothetical protein
VAKITGLTSGTITGLLDGLEKAHGCLLEPWQRVQNHGGSIRTSLMRPDAPLLIDTAAFTQRKWLATKTTSSLFALPSIA